ncbi:MAG: carboxypeptidase-like regulatory domain-containing protein [Leadbetterella sp.]|nr:carboxypeptidase-like regulatory domain-containing protein [Leadbetterella sp.]
MKRFTLIVWMILSGVAPGAFALETPYEMHLADITGKVIDEQLEPVVGAVVKNLRTGVAVQCDTDGNFKLSGEIGDQLEISFVGYQKLVVTYNSQKEFKLVIENSYLEELVVIGYGTNKKVNLSGAVDYVSGEVTGKPPDLQHFPGSARGHP